MDNLVNRLKEYLTKNSDFSVFMRSKSYNPELAEVIDNDYTFHCYGSYEFPYQISIWFNATGRVFSDCTCPYGGEGICKHQVASIEKLIEIIKNKAKSIEKNISKKETNSDTILPCKDGVLDKTKISQIKFNPAPYYYNPFRITSVKPNEVKGFFEDYRYNYEIILSYHKEKDEAVLRCTCGIKNPCYHKYLLMENFLDLFHFDYFSPRYLDNVKATFIADNKLPEGIPFDDLYNIKLNEEGITIEELYPNIIGNLDAPLRLYNFEKEKLYLPVKDEEKENLGFGICIRLRGQKYVGTFPFSGKLNKAKTEISTKLREIYSENIANIIHDNTPESDKDFLFSALKLSEYCQEFAYDNEVDYENFKRLFESTKNTFNALGERPIYLHNEKKSFVKKHIKTLTINEEEIVPVLSIKRNKLLFQLTFHIKLNNRKYLMSSNLINVLPIGILFKEELYLYSSIEQALSILSAAEKQQINILDKGIENLRTNIIQPFSSVFEIEFDLMENAQQKAFHAAPEKHVYISDENGEYVILKPLMQYENAQITPGSKEKLWVDEAAFDYYERDLELEDDFLQWMKNFHPNFKNKSVLFALQPDEAMEKMWLMEAIEKMQRNNIKVFGINELNSIKYNLNKPTFNINLSSGTDWFDMKLDINFGDQKADLKSLQKSLINNTNYVELKDGSIGILPKEWIDKYKKYFKLGQIKKDKIEISNYQFNIIDELYEDLTNTPKFLQELYEKKKRLLNLSELKSIAKPKGIKATLRDYQKEGLNWMAFLHENKLGGILADDMGLGKTLQTITFIQYLVNNTQKEDKLPHLVVAPTSLMFNWISEIKKFAPKLKTLLYTGPNRSELNKEMEKNDIVLTTYGSLINDIYFHKAQNYGYVILDESQAIKNPQSQRFKAVRLLQCQNRLALTGTPIENNTFDLYSQFNFLNPGIFGSIKHFRSTFSDAIDKEQDQETSRLLAKMIHPFILRRTKAQVAKELPSKTEAVIYCEMGHEQRKVYEEFKRYFREKLLEQIENEGINKSQMYILKGLTKLRQICNSTALADKVKDYGNYSAKMDELIRHLNEKVNNHKVLVFSQFVGMLDLIKNRLDAENIKFEYLDGQTKDREEKVNNFQNNKDVRVFLISLKAGGTGLNLTEADYVYLIDPWWNPAVESQAIDRCYRIGQDKKVMAYRMICKNTIEEQIVQLQDKKKFVASEVIQIDTEKKSFNKADIEKFFG